MFIGSCHERRKRVSSSKKPNHKLLSLWLLRSNRNDTRGPQIMYSIVNNYIVTYRRGSDTIWIQSSPGELTHPPASPFSAVLNL